MVSTRRTNTLRKRKVHSTPCKTKSPQKSTRRIKQATLKQAVKVKCDHTDTSRKKKILKEAKVKPDPTESKSRLPFNFIALGIEIDIELGGEILDHIHHRNSK